MKPRLFVSLFPNIKKKPKKTEPPSWENPKWVERFRFKTPVENPKCMECGGANVSVHYETGRVAAKKGKWTEFEYLKPVVKCNDAGCGGSLLAPEWRDAFNRAMNTANAVYIMSVTHCLLCDYHEGVKLESEMDRSRVHAMALSMCFLAERCRNED